MSKKLSITLSNHAYNEARIHARMKDIPVAIYVRECVTSENSKRRSKLAKYTEIAETIRALAASLPLERSEQSGDVSAPPEGNSPVKNNK